MNEPYLRARTEPGAVYDDPSEELVHHLLAEVEAGHGSWLILERVADRAGQTYAQTLRQDDGSYLVEFRAGGPDRHYGTVVDDMREAHALLTGWSLDLPGWHESARWELVRL